MIIWGFVQNIIITNQNRNANLITKFNGYFQIIGHWYEVEKSFNFPEIATGCTTMQFTSEAMQKDPNIIMPRLEVAVKNINEW